MTIDITTDELIPLSSVADYLASRMGSSPPRQIHHKTPYPWTTVGIRGVRLETIRIGREKHTSQRALQEFFAAVSETYEE